MHLPGWAAMSVSVVSRKCPNDHNCRYFTTVLGERQGLLCAKHETGCSFAAAASERRLCTAETAAGERDRDGLIGESIGDMVLVDVKAFFARSAEKVALAAAPGLWGQEYLAIDLGGKDDVFPVGHPLATEEA
jgi:hypothetical protein